jgi:dienelactone hydrolase
MLLALFARYIPAVAQEVPKEQPKLAEDIHETIAKVPVTVTLLSGKTYKGDIIITHFRPNGEGPFPIVIFNHGRASARRADPPRHRYTQIARYWIRRGFAVFVPTRLGYGDSGLDPDPEYSGGVCSDPKIDVALGAMLKQVDATLQFARTFAWADTTRVIVAGQSYGGFVSMGVNKQTPSSVLAAVNFSGGAGGSRTRPGNPCSPNSRPISSPKSAAAAKFRCSGSMRRTTGFGGPNGRADGIARMLRAEARRKW